MYVECLDMVGMIRGNWIKFWFIESKILFGVWIVGVII